MRPVECQGRQLKTAKQHHYAQQTDVFIQRPSVGKEVEGTDVPCALRGDRLQQGLEDAGRKAEQSSLYTRKGVGSRLHICGFTMPAWQDMPPLLNAGDLESK